MVQRLKLLVAAIRDSFSRPTVALVGLTASAARSGAARTLSALGGAKGSLATLGIVGAAAYVLYTHPPMQNVGRGEIGVRVNQLTGSVS
ncbi:MAG: hypothetical protein ACXWCX_26115, partial [Burkholderiales bacterium]